MHNNEIAIKFENVTKEYKLYKSDKRRFLGIFFPQVHHKIVRANDNVSFEIKKGESVMILGRNGAGKSTMLKMITEVVFPTTGEITVNGRVSALLELTAGFDAEFTGRENIYLKGQLIGLSNEEIADLEDDIIEFAELGDYIDQPVRTYSSGMMARLGFSINANIDPEILVIDEALSVGDKKFRLKCQAKIDDIVEKEHVTVLYVTHSPNSAEDFCNRGMVLDKGKLVFDGSYEQAVEAYEDILKN
jgi:teichoic acid transport system ATP-binding protein